METLEIEIRRLSFGFIVLLTERFLVFKTTPDFLYSDGTFEIQHLYLTKDVVKNGIFKDYQTANQAALDYRDMVKGRYSKILII